MKTEDAVSSNYYNRSIEHIPKKDSSVDTKAIMGQKYCVATSVEVVAGVAHIYNR